MAHQARSAQSERLLMDNSLSHMKRLSRLQVQVCLSNKRVSNIECTETLSPWDTKRGLVGQWTPDSILENALHAFCTESLARYCSSRELLLQLSEFVLQFPHLIVCQGLLLRIVL